MFLATENWLLFSVSNKLKKKENNQDSEWTSNDNLMKFSNFIDWKRTSKNNMKKERTKKDEQ